MFRKSINPASSHTETLNLVQTHFDRQKNSSIISKDFLKESLKSLDEKKRDHSLCSKCTKLGIPPYQLGVNLKGWDEKAKENSEIFAKKLR